MGLNSKELKTRSTAKKLPKPKDVIYDPEGQWKYPGQVTKIPGGDITMAGVNYPVFGVDNLGNQQMMYPGMNYTFPGDNVTEYPMMKKGGQKDPRNFTNQNIQSSINQLMLRNKLLFGPGGRNIYSPLKQDAMKKSKKLKKYPEGGESLFPSHIPYKDQKMIYDSTSRWNSMMDANKNNYSNLHRQANQFYASPESKLFDEVTTKYGLKIFDDSKQISSPNATVTPNYAYAKKYTIPVDPSTVKPISPQVIPQPLPTGDPNYQAPVKQFKGFHKPTVGMAGNIPEGYNISDFNPNNEQPKIIPSPVFFDGGIAFPTQPTQKQFFNFGKVPQGPVGFYMNGGINTDGLAFPQQPTEKIFFSAFPWNPKYAHGGLPEAFPQQPPQNIFFSGAPFTPEYNLGGAPCYECGGKMEDGGVSGFHMMSDGSMMMNEDMQGEYKSGGWIQKATKGMRTDKPCTGPKFGGPTCPPGSKRYNLAKTFRAMAKKAMGGESGDGVDQDDYTGNMTNAFMSTIKNNTMMNIADQASQDVSNMYAQDGGNFGGMSMEDYGFNPDMMNNQMYQDKYNQMMNNQQQAGQNFFDQSMNMMSKMQKGGTGGGGPQKGQTYNEWIRSQGSPGGIKYDGRTWDGEKWVGELKPDFNTKDQDYQDYLDYQNFLKHKQNMPAPTYQAGYNQGYRYFPANYNRGYKIQGNQQLPAGITMPLSVKQDYGALDRFITGFRKDKNKHTFGPKSTTVTFRTYTDPYTGETKQAPASGDGQMNTADTNINSDQSNYISHPNYSAPSSVDLEAENWQQIGDNINANRYDNPLQQNVIESMKDFNPMPDFMSSQKRYGGLPKAQAGMFNPNCTEDDKMNPNSPCYTPNFLNQGMGFGQGRAGQPGFINNPVGDYHPDKYTDTSIKFKKDRFGNMSGEDKANWLMAGTDFLTAGLNAETPEQKKKRKDMMLADNQFMVQPANRIQNQGRYQWTGMGTGMMDPNSMDVIQQPGILSKYGGPQYQDGGEYELTDEEIAEIYAKGGSVEFLD